MDASHSSHFIWNEEEADIVYMIYHLYHIIYTNILLPKVPYYQKFQEHLPYINFVPVSEFSLENDKIKMKLVVKYNLLKYADNEEQPQPENRW